MVLRFVFLLIVCLCSRMSLAQGLRISTQVYDISQGDTRTPAGIIASSLTLCHNGRVYDFVDAANEVVIFDPVERRFTVMNTERNLTTRLTFDEIRHMLRSREPRTRDYIDELMRSEKESALQLAASIEFQLTPKFVETFDEMKGTLVLMSPSFTYRVETRKWQDPEQVDRYLIYADWTARLNSILHPGSLFPEPRLALNESPRKLGNRMPVAVELDLRPGEQFRLKAVHQLTPSLIEDDQQRIVRWEEQLKDGSMKDVSVQNYQAAVLLSTNRR